jgi:hypothetical protein
MCCKGNTSASGLRSANGLQRFSQLHSPYGRRSEEDGAVKANEKKKKQPAFDADTFLATMDGGRLVGRGQYQSGVW